MIRGTVGASATGTIENTAAFTTPTPRPDGGSKPITATAPPVSISASTASPSPGEMLHGQIMLRRLYHRMPDSCLRHNDHSPAAAGKARLYLRGMA